MKSAYTKSGRGGKLGGLLEAIDSPPKGKLHAYPTVHWVRAGVQICDRWYAGKSGSYLKRRVGQFTGVQWYRTKGSK